MACLPSLISVDFHGVVQWPTPIHVDPEFSDARRAQAHAGFPHGFDFLFCSLVDGRQEVGGDGVGLGGRAIVDSGLLVPS